jgi:hypothetical protein
LLGVFLVKSILLARHLWWFSLRRRISPAKPDDDSAQAERLAKSALSNRKWSAKCQRSLTPRALQLADIKFLYRWDMCSAEVGSLKGLMVQTILVSTLATLWLTTSLLMKIASQKSHSAPVIAGGMAEAFAPLVYAAFLCFMFYAASNWYRGMLARRRIAWNHFLALVRYHATAQAERNAGS